MANPRGAPLPLCSDCAACVTTAAPPAKGPGGPAPVESSNPLRILTLCVQRLPGTGDSAPFRDHFAFQKLGSLRHFHFHIIHLYVFSHILFQSCSILPHSLDP